MTPYRASLSILTIMRADGFAERAVESTCPISAGICSGATSRLTSCPFCRHVTRTDGALVTEIVMICDSGDLASELDSGSVILSFSGGFICVVVMKKISSRKATSTVSVMSMAMPIRRFCFSIAGFLLRLPVVGGRGGEQLDRLVRRLVHHVVEVVDAGHEHVVGDDPGDGDEQPAGR